MKIALVIFDRFTDLDLFLPWDLLNRVRSVAGVEDWQVKIVGTKDTHVSDAGLPIQTMGTIDELQEMDAVLFTSGVLVPELIQDPEYLSRLKLAPDRQWIGSMCSGALILAALGLLEGKEATTYPTRRKMLEKMNVKVVAQDFVSDGRIATAAGCLAAQQLAEWVIASAIGPKVAAQVLRTIQPVGKGL
ncbi:DJ-1/PfpI family protein [Paenibacillus tyrfis]|uniref:DJ-1/PfpI family protein n=1 Tax=Paenibacillus tyrfis TaxID=1501230 RepID=UPI000B58F6AF|nr:DJ-1/PfpI family protein [Paenibacillus tyrfis]